jgi:hypothetical protein
MPEHCCLAAPDHLYRPDGETNIPIMHPCALDATRMNDGPVCTCVNECPSLLAAKVDHRVDALARSSVAIRLDLRPRCSSRKGKKK